MSDARPGDEPTIRALLDQAGEEIVAGNPFRALGCVNSALALLDQAREARAASPDGFIRYTPGRLVPDPGSAE